MREHLPQAPGALPPPSTGARTAARRLKLPLRLVLPCIILGVLIAGFVISIVVSHVSAGVIARGHLVMALGLAGLTRSAPRAGIRRPVPGARPAAPPATPTPRSGRSAARLARLLREQEVESSNLSAPTTPFPDRVRHLPGRRPGTLRLAATVLLVAMWSLAAAAQEVPRYTVRKGDSLSLISKRLGVSVARLKGANGLSSDVIHVGQQLSVPEAFKGIKPANVRWSRPVAKVGRTIRPFGNYQQGKLVLPSSGRDISCQPGTRVLAPAHGVVRHAGVMEGVGTVVIIEHGGGWTSVLAPLEATTLEARPGQVVLGGDLLALLAAPAAAAEEPYLHVELRKNNKAVAPDRLLR